MAFGGLAQVGAKALGGARFSLVNLVPATVLVVFVTLLVGSGMYRLESQPDFGKPVRDLADNAGLAIVAVFGVFVLAVMLRPFQAWLVQLLEGYWERWPILDYAAALAIERHRRIRHTAEVIRQASVVDTDPPEHGALAGVSAWQRHEHWRTLTLARAVEIAGRYPQRPRKDPDEPPEFEPSPNDRLMPTLLGNVLRKGEDTAGNRYGLRLEVVGTRLYPCLSPTTRAAIDQNLDLLDVSAAICVSFAAGAIFSAPLVVRWDLWSLIPLVVLAFAVLAYRGAIRVATTNKTLLAAAVDLHRFDMISALHYKLPKTTDEEWKLNQALSEFLDGTRTIMEDVNLNSATNRTYEHPQAAEVRLQLAGDSGKPEADAGGTTD